MSLWLVSGLEMWTGDLQHCYEQYKSKLAFTSGIGLGSRQGRTTVKDDVTTIYTRLQSDKNFISKGTCISVYNPTITDLCCKFMFTLELADAERKYQEKIQSKESNKAQFDAGWKVKELKRLVDSSQHLIADVSTVIQLVSDPATDVVHTNVALRLDCIRGPVSPKIYLGIGEFLQLISLSC